MSSSSTRLLRRKPTRAGKGFHDEADDEAGIIVLISGYSLAILRGKRRALAMSGMLVILYGYLYVLLQAEDYALLLGSIGLFVILALVMFLTRKVDWYSPRMEKATAP